ncbi:MAG: hypothetical protein M3O06_10915, partial [Pseudomonadota bacterium]|nr:hypothetical protein [Pseudomonadota bacterium]
LDGTVQLLEAWLLLNAAERAAMAQAARDLFARRFTIDAMANALLDVVRQHALEPQPIVA